MFKCLSHLGAAKHTVQFHISAWSSSYKPRLPLHCRCRPKCLAGLPQWKVPKAPKRYRWHEVTSAYDDGLMLKMVWWWRRCLDQFGQLMSVHSGMHCSRLCGIVDLDGVTLESTSRAMFQLQKPETCVWHQFECLSACWSNNTHHEPPFETTRGIRPSASCAVLILGVTFNGFFAMQQTSSLSSMISCCRASGEGPAFSWTVRFNSHFVGKG